MKSDKTLKKGKTYRIVYPGYHEYDGYNGSGVYAGETNEIGGKVYGFKIPNAKDICWFPLESIFKDE
jgi:hypothetical protein